MNVSTMKLVSLANLANFFSNPISTSTVYH